MSYVASGLWWMMVFLFYFILFYFILFGGGWWLSGFCGYWVVVADLILFYVF